MAQIPYTSEIKSKKINTDLTTRLYIFMQVNKIIDGLKILNDSKQNKEDIKNFGEHLISRYNGYLNDEITDDKEIADVTEMFKDEKLADVTYNMILAESDEEKFAQLLPFIAHKISKTVISEGSKYNQLDTGISECIAPSLIGTLYTILDKENSKINAEDIATHIVDGCLQVSEIPATVNALQSAKSKVMQRLKTDWQTYEDTRSPNPNIEKFREYFESALNDSKDFHYKTYPETRNTLLCIRDDFADSTTGSKTSFLKMMGYMLDCGHKQLSALTPASAQIPNNNNYQQFIALIKEQYQNDAENAIDSVLEISGADNSEQARRAAFDKKSKELYCKFLSAILTKKKEQNAAEHTTNFDYQKYINQNVPAYIADMKKGKNNIAANLHLADESKSQSLKQLIDDTAETQIISVHHKIPVASAVPLYVKLHPEMHSSAKMQELMKELATVCPQAVQGRAPEDIAIIGLALSVFPEEGKKDNIAAVYKIADAEKREKKLQILKNKEAIRKLYQKYFPLEHGQAKSIKNEILRIVNNPSNHTLPIGSVVHQNMEPNGNATISKQDDKIFINVQNTSKLGLTTSDKVNNSTVLAAEYNSKDLAEIVVKLNPKFRDGIAQYDPTLKKLAAMGKDSANAGSIKPQTVAVRVLLNLPETGFMNQMRNLLNTAQRVSSSEYLRQIVTPCRR